MNTPETQTVLLQALRSARRARASRGWVSAREIALANGVSLNAIHQAVHRLRQTGWPIHTSQRGARMGLSYRLADSPLTAPTPPLTPPARRGTKFVRIANTLAEADADELADPAIRTLTRSEWAQIPPDPEPDDL